MENPKVKISVEHTTKIFSGKEFPVTITRRIGRNTYFHNGEMIEADEYITLDYGPKQGTSHVFVHYSEDKSLETIEKNRREICRIAGRA